MPDPIQFSAPIIGPKVYIAKGPSGWPETFNRDTADRQLVDFVTPLDLPELIETFVLQRTLNSDEPTSWAHVTHFLARNLQVPLKTIPDAVGVAFWAKVIIALQTSQHSSTN